jgi:hypothetical protein
MAARARGRAGEVTEVAQVVTGVGRLRVDLRKLNLVGTAGLDGNGRAGYRYEVSSAPRSLVSSE